MSVPCTVVWHRIKSQERETSSGRVVREELASVVLSPLKTTNAFREELQGEVNNALKRHLFPGRRRLFGGGLSRVNLRHVCAWGVSFRSACYRFKRFKGELLVFRRIAVAGGAGQVTFHVLN